MPERASRAGFSLVEMLVALTIFALIAGTGVGLLRASVDTQAAVDGRLADVGELGRLHALLAGDLGQAVDRPGQPGDRPQFQGEASRMAFTRAGWSNLDGSARSDLQQVAWRFGQGELVRTGHDRTAPDKGIDAVFAKDLASAAIRYRRFDGSWVPAFTSSPEEPLPAAVELTLTRSGQSAVTLVVGLGRSGAPES